MSKRPPGGWLGDVPGRQVLEARRFLHQNTLILMSLRQVFAFQRPRVGKSRLLGDPGWRSRFLKDVSGKIAAFWAAWMEDSDFCKAWSPDHGFLEVASGKISFFCGADDRSRHLGRRGLVIAALFWGRGGQLGFLQRAGELFLAFGKARACWSCFVNLGVAMRCFSRLARRLAASPFKKRCADMSASNVSRETFQACETS